MLYFKWSIPNEGIYTFAIVYKCLQNTAFTSYSASGKDIFQPNNLKRKNLNHVIIDYVNLKKSTISLLKKAGKSDAIDIIDKFFQSLKTLL